MATLFYASISSVDYTAGTASVSIPDRESQVIKGVPFTAACYDMPSPGDTVAAVFEEVGGQIGKGVILGKIFGAPNRPSGGGRGVFYKEFEDGTRVSYSTSEKKMSITVETLEVNKLKTGDIEAGDITCTGINR
jgi:phage baseplate assembly protein gpV